MLKRVYATPLLPALLALISGIYLQSILLIDIKMLTLLLLAVTLGALIFSYKHQLTLAKISLYVLVFCAGALALALQTSQREAQIALYAGKPHMIHAIVEEKDSWGDSGDGDVLRLHVTRLSGKEPEESSSVRFKILCYSRVPIRALVGDSVTASNITIKKPRSVCLAGNPTYDDYLLKEQLLGSVFLTPEQHCNVTGRPLISPSRWWWQLRKTVYFSLKKVLPSRTFAYFGLIFLGNKQHEHTTQMRTMFGYWGLSHYLARSGLHIVLFIMIWMFLLRLLPIHIFFKKILLISICALYDLLSWSSIPFARAYYVFLFAQTGQLMGKQTSFLHLLTLVCCGILLFNPMQLFFLDFQLTFGLTFTLVLFSYLARETQDT